jgi:hypothetical protein
VKPWPIVLPALLFCAGCGDHAFAVVSVVTYAGTMDPVARLRVHVTGDQATQPLLYPKQSTQSLRLDATHPVTFSVEFASAPASQVRFEVEALSTDWKALGYGTSLASIRKNAVSNVPVSIAVGALRPEHIVDNDVCSLTAAAAACGADRTCGVLCSDTTSVNMCYLSGTEKPGAACTSNNDCVSGAQCFTFTAVGCNVKTCLKFCSDDASCSEANAYCNTPISCGNAPGIRTCSRPCDPTVTNNNGCAAGLGCFRYPKDATDCACPGFGVAGAPCTQNSGCNDEPGCLGCAAGLSCFLPQGTDAGAPVGVCRPVCKRAAPSCPSGLTCYAFESPSEQPSSYGYCQ